MFIQQLKLNLLPVHQHNEQFFFSRNCHCFIRDVAQPNGVRRKTTSAMRREYWDRFRILFYDTPVDVALHCYRVGLLDTKLELRKIAEATLEEFLSFPPSDFSSEQALDARTAELHAGLLQVNDVLQGGATFACSTSSTVVDHQHGGSSSVGGGGGPPPPPPMGVSTLAGGGPPPGTTPAAASRGHPADHHQHAFAGGEIITSPEQLQQLLGGSVLVGGECRRGEMSSML